MLSTKLVVLIEDHWQGISSAVLHTLRADAKLLHMRTLPLWNFTRSAEPYCATSVTGLRHPEATRT